ncbi:MAG: hypothetical protein AAF598_19805, partial [Bacteroidota bacterium]
MTIAISPVDFNLIYVSTSPIFNGPGGVFRSTNDGASWLEGSGLPDRVFMDIVAHPSDENIAYAVCGGFGTDHLWRSDDKGLTWQAWGVGLPDVPTHTMVFHPSIEDIQFIGNDLGVYWSYDGGLNWEIYSNGLPDAVMVMHLSISEANNKLRVATHGYGVWESPILNNPLVSIEETIRPEVAVRIFPNPVMETLNIQIDYDEVNNGQLFLYDNWGRQIRTVKDILVSGGSQIER